MKSQYFLYSDEESYTNYGENEEKIIIKHKLSKKIIIITSVFIAVTFCMLMYVVSMFMTSFDIDDTVLPTTTELTTTYSGTTDVTAHIEKRFLWTLGVAVFQTAGLGFAILGVDSACKSYNKDGSAVSGLLCVTGALTTAVTIGGRVKAALSALNLAAANANNLQIALAGIQTGFISGRSYSNHTMMLDSINSNLTASFGTPYKLHGFMNKNNTKHGFMIPDNHTIWPVYELTNHHGHKMHHMITPMKNGNYMNRLAYAPAVSKRDVYDDEYFSNGGIDFTACDNTADSNQFNEGDFGYVEPTIQCALGDIDSVSSFEYQIYDDTMQSTIGSGSIAGVDSSGNTEINSDPQCPSGLSEPDCPQENSSG